MTNTGASVINTIDTRLVPGASLAEYLFKTPVDTFVKCDMCNLPTMELITVGDSAVFKIRSRHYGSKHVSIIPIEKLGLRLV